MSLDKNQIFIKTNSSEYKINIFDQAINTSSISEFIENKEIIFIYDSNLDKQKINNLLGSITSQTKQKVVSIKLEVKEEKKNLETLTEIHNKLVENKFSRDCLVIAVGGGIICDLSGFAAATYQRGVDFLLIPTTLLAQVDASIGGKTAINHSLGKNMIGAFHQPKAVLIDTSFLKTLPRRELNCGLVEMIKHSLIADKNFFSWIKENIEEIKSFKGERIKESIRRSIEIKANIVSIDEKEKGIRAILNFGHTFGHAIELLGKYKDYNHGEAVALGIMCALQLSKKICNLKEEEINRIRDLFTAFGINIRLAKPLNVEKLYEAMQSDKKKGVNDLNFILIKEIGSAKKYSDISKKEVLDAIERSIFPI